MCGLGLEFGWLGSEDSKNNQKSERMKVIVRNRDIPYQGTLLPRPPLRLAWEAPSGGDVRCPLSATSTVIILPQPRHACGRLAGLPVILWTLQVHI